MRKKSKKTNCYSEDSKLLNLGESIPVANTCLEIDSQQLAILGISDRYFNRNYYTGINPLTDSIDLILGQNNFRTSLLSDKNHCSSLDGFVSVANTYLGVGSPQIATICASNKYFNRNVYPGVNAAANSTDLILGQSTIRTSVLSDNKHWLNLNESVSAANTYLGVGSPQLDSIGASDNFFNSNVYTGLISAANSTNLTLGQSNFGTSLLSDMSHWSNLVGSVSVGNTSLKIGSSQLATFSVFDEYSKMSIKSNVKPTAYLTDFDLSQSVEKASLIVEEKNSSTLAGALLAGNTYMGVGLTELPNVNSFDRYHNKNNYSVRNPTELIFDYSLRKSVLKDSLFSVNEYLSEIVNSSIADNFKCISIRIAQTKSVYDSLIVDNFYSTGLSPLCITGIDFGQSIVNTDLNSINNYLYGTQSVFFPNEGYSNIGLNKDSSLGNDFSFVRNINEVIPSDAVTYFNNPVITSNQFESRRLGLMCEIEKKFKDFLETIKLDKNHIGLEFTADKYNFHLNINIMNCTINSNQIQFGNKYIN